MQSKKVADNSDKLATGRAQIDTFLRREPRAEREKNLGPRVGHLDGLGTALIDIYETGPNHPIKTDLLDQVVSIIRRKKRPDERVRAIANLMRGWQKVRRD
jgi:hypothetical protein